uniref:Kringle domain-containing protein n=1 Tax=Callorhinchus milii TaxID=7868 RepID=A0A4W3H461_CALMI
LKLPSVATEMQCYTGKTGTTYRGIVQTTKSGKTCQRWDSQKPHQHIRIYKDYPNKGLIENYCRNPGDGEAPWCYTMDPDVRWEYCSILSSSFT